MINYLLRLAFVGTNFSGWQVQPKERTVQGVLQEALSKIFNEEIKVIGCCRTDAGVHALDYVANFKAKKDFPEEKLLLALNGILPKDIGVYEVRKVSPEFNARYSVKGKVYLYKIWNSEVRNPFLYPFTWQVKKGINFELLKRTLELVRGEHDFRAFAKLEEEKNTVINLEEVSLKREGKLIEIRLRASHFLRYMVRRIVGTAVKIALGVYEPSLMEELLKGKGKAPYTAPPQGLHLEKVIL
ncbi:tRNA pseudouridine(38-40) synthase TruA [Aquifex pyrophilus]